MEEVTLLADSSRTGRASRPARRLRAQGQVPAVALRPRHRAGSARRRQPRAPQRVDRRFRSQRADQPRRRGHQALGDGSASSAQSGARQRVARRLRDRTTRRGRCPPTSRCISSVKPARSSPKTESSISRCSRSPSEPSRPTSPATSRSTSPPSRSATPSGWATSDCPPGSRPRWTPTSPSRWVSPRGGRGARGR